MKSASEWRSELNFSDTTTEDDIRTIQLDAMKEGMRRAAELANKHFEDDNWNEMFRQAGYQINSVITDAANQLTEADMK